jgi:hypothetical protein
MFILSLVLLAVWAVALGVFHVSDNSVHILLILSLASFGWHLWDKARRRTFADGPRGRR